MAKLLDVLCRQDCFHSQESQFSELLLLVITLVAGYQKRQPTFDLCYPNRKSPEYAPECEGAPVTRLHHSALGPAG